MQLNSLIKKLKDWVNGTAKIEAYIIITDAAVFKKDINTVEEWIKECK